MTGEQIAGIVRAVVAAVGGYLVGKGFADAETVAAVGGALATIAVAIWSVRSKKKPEAV
jgi:O-antigen/teichoic acid export membrane protein